MKEERLICPTTPKLSHLTERCLKTKLQIYTAPRNDTYLLLAVVTVSPICILSTRFQFPFRFLCPVVHMMIMVDNVLLSERS